MHYRLPFLKITNGFRTSFQSTLESYIANQLEMIVASCTNFSKKIHFDIIYGFEETIITVTSNVYYDDITDFEVCRFT